MQAEVEVVDAPLQPLPEYVEVEPEVGVTVQVVLEVTIELEVEVVVE